MVSRIAVPAGDYVLDDDNAVAVPYDFVADDIAALAMVLGLACG